MIWVSLSGPLSNFALAIAAAFIMWFLRSFNFLPNDISFNIITLMYMVLSINVLLGVFNMVPVPPLDGSKVLSGLLPPALAARFQMIEPYGFYILIFLVMSGSFWSVLGPIISFIIMALTGRISLY